MEEKDTKQLLEIVKNNDLWVSKTYRYIDNKLLIVYSIPNYCSECSYDDFFQDLCKSYDISFENIAEIIYNELQIKYSQENEFFLD